jgi:S1-C subfamily serine protease
MNSWRRRVLLLAVMMFALGLRSEIVAQNALDVTVFNETGGVLGNPPPPMPMTGIFLAPAASGVWGPNLLGSQSDVAEFVHIRLADPPGCIFNVRVTYSGGQSEQRSRQDLCKIGTLFFFRPTLTTTRGPALVLVNHSPYPIIHAYLSPGEFGYREENPREDPLKGRALPTGNQVRFDLGRENGCFYDLKIEYEGIEVPDFKSIRPIDLCETSEQVRVYTGPLTSARSRPLTRPSFTFYNISSIPVSQLHVAEPQSAWGNNLLSEQLLEGKGLGWPSLPSSSCVLDLRIIDAQGQVYERRGLDLCWTERVYHENVTVFRVDGAGGRITEESPRSYGTGFFVSSRGHAVTNYHVVDGCRSVVALLDGRQVEAHVVRSDERNDLTLLSIGVQNSVPYARFRGTPGIRPGDGVVVAGFPLPGILSGLNITTGNLTALAGPSGNAALVQVTAPVQPGNSGGPLLDMTGNVVGVVVSSLDALRVAQAVGNVPQNINFAVNGVMVRLFLEASGQRIDERTPTSALPVGEVGDMARAFTFQIECRR